MPALLDQFQDEVQCCGWNIRLINEQYNNHLGTATSTCSLAAGQPATYRMECGRLDDESIAAVCDCRTTTERMLIDVSQQLGVISAIIASLEFVTLILTCSI